MRLSLCAARFCSILPVCILHICVAFVLLVSSLVFVCLIVRVIAYAFAAVCCNVAFPLTLVCILHVRVALVCVVCLCVFVCSCCV